MADAPLPSQLPKIRRARGYRLYAENGRRYLDLWQGGGRALLGHRSARLTTVLKNVISTGLIADLPSGYSGRLERALAREFAGFPHFRLAGSLEGALGIASRYLGRVVTRADVRDPLWESPPAAGDVALWRPFLDIPEGAAVLLPVLPFAVAGAPVAVGFSVPPPADLPPSEPLSPLILAGALRALDDLRRHEPPGWVRPGLLRGATGWRQKGPYVTPDFEQLRYPSVFAAFLAEGVLLNPVFPGPSILPGEASPGELKKMIGLFRRFPGK
jgi:hypothetical protein